MIKCQICGKNPATVHLTDIAKGGNREKHVCEACAAAEGIATGKTPVSLNEWLANFVMQQSASMGAERTAPACSNCGMTFSEFRQRGLLGCAGCYSSFQAMLLPLIQRAHENADHHVGKIPPHVEPSQRRQYELIELRRRLNESVAQERYEEAAQLRDRIMKLENG